MKKCILQIINKWDPVGLNSITPSDEYLPEVKQIISCLSKNNTPTELAHDIYNIFYNAFGEIFQKTYEECVFVASQINQGLSKQNDTLR